MTKPNNYKNKKHIPLTSPASSITIYDTSLRDGLQGEKINLNLNEKLMAVKALDRLGIHYIEGGFPLASENEAEFFKQVRKLKLKHATIVAFGSTRKPKAKVETDPHIQALAKAGTKTVTIVGKTWTRHVKEVLGTTLEENLSMIHDSVSYLKKKGKEVIYDGEHFFDGFKEDPEYSILTLETALNAGVDWVIPCDTNGGIDYDNFIAAIKRVSACITSYHTKGNKGNSAKYGVHLHNDTESAVAYSMIALEYGALQIQGTINGWGERCGNTNLIAVIGNIHFKTKYKVFTDSQIRELTFVSRYMDELANLIPNDKQGYVGRSAFAHKAGQHADVILKNPTIMEHISGDSVGNGRRILLSELAGKSTILFKMERFGSFNKQSKEVVVMTNELKRKEQQGYEYEAAEGSFELLIRKHIGKYRPLFEKSEFRVNIYTQDHESNSSKLLRSNFNSENSFADIITWAFIKVTIKGEDYLGDAEGVGPVGALDHAFKKAIVRRYPFINHIRLDDYKVRVLNGDKASDAKVRVLIKTSIHDKNNKNFSGRTWGTVGVSENIIDASWQALRDSFEYAFNEFNFK